MLKDWLKTSERSSGSFYFNVNDIDEKNPRDLEKINEIFSKIIINESSRYDAVKKLTQKYGWNKIFNSIIIPRLPRNSNMQKGRFGEMLESAILETFFEFVIPVKKLRHAISSDQSLPSCDIVAVKFDGSQIREISFIESKLSIGHDSTRIVKAYNQLMNEKEKGFSEILSFIITELIDEKKPLSEKFIEYCLTKDRSNDSYRIASTYDNEKWDEKSLIKLNDLHTKPIPNLTVDVIKIIELEKLIKHVYEKNSWNTIE